MAVTLDPAYYDNYTISTAAKELWNVHYKILLPTALCSRVECLGDYAITGVPLILKAHNVALMLMYL